MLRITIITLQIILCALNPQWILATKLSGKRSFSEENSCDTLISRELKDEIQSYKQITNQIINFVLDGPFKGRTYKELAYFVDNFGARPSGSETLEKAIDYMIEKTKQEGVNDITTESLTVPRWKRCDEEVFMSYPYKKKINALGLGTSVSTDPQGISAEVIVVKSFEELENLDDDLVKGKIVVYDQKFISYGETVKYRSQGASKAAEKGALAALVRSITPFSISSPHTGMQSYLDGVVKIPVAAISIEDADLLGRLQSYGIKAVVSVKMSSTLVNRISRNTIVDIKGKENPESSVIVSGHIDSWDVGQGAMDDGGGLFISWAAPIILHKLNLSPRRTLRAIFWTAEELGLVGAYAYANKHKNDLHKINFVMESDEGTFTPRGLFVSGTTEGKCIIAEILNLFNHINASTLVENSSPGSDIITITSNGIPGAGLYNDNDKYFWYHHTEGDMMNVEDPRDLDLGAAFWTAVSYVIADLSVDIPKIK